MNWKMMIVSNWKIALLILQLSLLATMIITGQAHAGEPIDNPGPP